MLKKDPGDGTSLCPNDFNVKTLAEINKLEDRTPAEIRAIQHNRKTINYGLYLRSRMLCSSKNESLTFVVPMKHLNLFFSHECYIPLRQVITVEFVMHDDRNLLIVKDGLANDTRYKLSIAKAFLTIRLCTMEPRLHTKWLSSIDSLSLTRNFQGSKVVHFNIKKDARTARYSSVFSYSALPAYLKIFFISERAHTGDYQTNKLSYTNHNVQSISIFKSGLPHATNTITVDMDMRKNGFHHQYFYREYQKFYGNTSFDVTSEMFYDDLFCYCFNLSPNPILNGDHGIVTEADDRILSFVEGAVLDVNIAFSEALPENTMVFFVGYFDMVQSWDSNGMPLT